MACNSQIRVSSTIASGGAARGLPWASAGRWKALLAGLSLLIGASAVAQGGAEYPAPRFPDWVVQPSMEQLMEAARVAVRQTHGRSQLGVVAEGETVHVFLNYSQDMDVWNAMEAAWAERGVTAIPVMGWELSGISRDAYEEQARNNLIRGTDGWKEFGVFEPAYAAFFPEDIRESFGDPMTTTAQLGGLEYPPRPGPLLAFMENHPEVENLVAYAGGRSFIKAAMGREHAHKFVANWTYLNKADLLSNMRAFPSELWKMIDEQIVRPIPHVSEGTFEDPEGTRLHWTLTPRQSRLWDEVSGLSSYNPGHLNVYPPPARDTWKEGTIVASGNHTGYLPEPMAVHINERGRVIRVEGGGKGGDLFRMLLEHPKFRDTHFPSAPEPGYWYLTQDGLGTNPKEIRNLEKLAEGIIDMANLSERNRAGVQHLSFSHAVSGDVSISPRDVAYARERGIPLSHTSHMHVYFPTVKWRLRDTGEWISVIEKGRLAVFDNPEVRAMATRYGDPDVLFSYDWIPAIPGINVAGDYERDYARSPWSWISSVWERIKDGSYDYYVEEYAMFQ